MSIHILSGCGSFMAGLASIISESKQKVKAYDVAFLPPMLNQLSTAQVEMIEGYQDHSQIQPEDQVIVGNAIKRGNPMLEHLLANNHPLISGPEWLKQQVLSKRRTLAFAGTHGKTTTTAMMSWVLEYLGEEPGFLVGGIPLNMQTSARLGKGSWFVIEADEYDTVLWDKRPKFMHYPAELVVINNLEFDHADIFRDLDDITQQFSYYLKTLKPGAKVVYPASSELISKLVEQAPWVKACPMHAQQSGQPYHLRALADDWSKFVLYDQEAKEHIVQWDLWGEHNAMNALSVFTAACELGLDNEKVTQAITAFQGVQRRMQRIGKSSQQQTVWDDFAHHPTALSSVIKAARSRFREGRIVIYLKLINYTQREGIMWQQLQQSTAGADLVLLLQNNPNFPYQLFKSSHASPVVLLDEDMTSEQLSHHLQPGDHIITCSSRDCSNMHQAVLAL